jgi:hypothetical protein
VNSCGSEVTVAKNSTIEEDDKTNWVVKMTKKYPEVNLTIIFWPPLLLQSNLTFLTSECIYTPSLQTTVYKKVPYKSEFATM